MRLRSSLVYLGSKCTEAIVLGGAYRARLQVAIYDNNRSAVVYLGELNEIDDPA